MLPSPVADLSDIKYLINFNGINFDYFSLHLKWSNIMEYSFVVAIHRKMQNFLCNAYNSYS